MKEKYESLSLAVLKELAKARGMKGTSALRKAQLVEAMLRQDEKDKAAAEKESANNQEEEKNSPSAGKDASEESERKREKNSEKNRQRENFRKSRESAPQKGSEESVPAGVKQKRAAEELTPQAGMPKKADDARTQHSGMGRNTEDTRMQRNGGVKNSASGTGGREDSQDRPSVSRRRRVPEAGSRVSYERGNLERRNYVPRMRTNPGEAAENRRGHGTAGSNTENRGSGTAGSNTENRDSATAGSNTENRGYGNPGSSQENRNFGSAAGPVEEPAVGGTSDSPEERGYRNAGNSAEETAYGNPENTAEDRSAVGQNSAETKRSEGQQSRFAEPFAAAESRMSDADRPPAELSQLDSGQLVRGILEVMQDGYGFIRSDNYLPGENDVYVSPSQIRRFNLKTGDIISGNTRIKSQQEKFSALLYLKKINDLAPSEAMKRYNFEDMTPIFPNERLRMEREPRGIAMRIVDLFSPIGKGQRGMIVSPPKAGKTTLLKDIARSILKNNPEMRLLILLIDERPEEVTDIKEAICGDNVEVIYSTFDETPEHHKRVSEMVIERAKRLVEQKQDVTILLDSITRLARAYNLTVPPSGRTLSGGLDPAALHMPKRFFGAARNMREGGSLTILATALVDTGSKMDDVVYEEFKGTGNMELVLDRKLSERRVFPAIDIPKSGTRREDLLLDREEQEAIYYMRRALNGMKSDDAAESILNMLVHTRDNHDLVQRVRRQKGV